MIVKHKNGSITNIWTRKMRIKKSIPIFKKYYRHLSDKEPAFKVGDIVDILVPKEHLFSDEDLVEKNVRIFKIRYHRFMDRYVYVYSSLYYVNSEGKFIYAFPRDTFEPYMTLVKREEKNDN